MNALYKIRDMLSLLDRPTAYIMLFTLCWFIVLVLSWIFMKKQNKRVTILLALFPLINFGIFYVMNYVKGWQIYGIKRYGAHLVAAVVYAIAAFLYPRIKKKATMIVVTGVAVLAVSLCSVLYVLGLDGAWHLGNFSHMRYEASMAALIDELEQNYVLGEYKEIDYEKLRAEFIPKAAAADRNQDEVAFAVAVAELCYEFHDGHLSYHMRNREAIEEIEKRLIGQSHDFSMIRTDDGKVLAILTNKQSDTYAQGIHDGTVITGWNGVDIDEAIANVRCVNPDSLRSTSIAANEEIFKPIYLAGQGGETVQVRFLDDEGVEKEIAITSTKNNSNYARCYLTEWPLTGKLCNVNADHSSKPIFLSLKAQSDYDDEFLYGTMLDEHCGYLFIPDETYDDLGDLFATLSDSYPEIKKIVISKMEELKAQGMDRLIIDIRGNSGGFYVICKEIVSLFTDHEIIKYCGFPVDGGFKADKHWIWRTPVDGRYADLPVVVLVNSGCGSAGDLLAYDLSQCPNVTIMGTTTTWGCAQEPAGRCILSSGNIIVRYPVITTLEADNTVTIDAGADRVSRILLDERIPLDEEAVEDIYVRYIDHELEYAHDFINRMSLPKP